MQGDAETIDSLLRILAYDYAKCWPIFKILSIQTRHKSFPL